VLGEDLGDGGLEGAEILGRRLAIAFLSELRWSIAAAAMMPRSSAQALIPSNLPRVRCTFAIEIPPLIVKG
jgi:hypothetical protein